MSDEQCRPLVFSLTPGQTADITRAVMFGTRLPRAQYLLADKAYEADHWRQYLKSRHIIPVIPNKRNRKKLHPFNKARYKGRNVLVRMFGRLKDFRRIATRYDKNAINFMAALCLAALICDWI
ncbi:MAG: transposase [Magnetovibrio sp.]|nr:transposase [Magnetovibrio sp.]